MRSSKSEGNLQRLESRCASRLLTICAHGHRRVCGVVYSCVRQRRVALWCGRVLSYCDATRPAADVATPFASETCVRWDVPFVGERWNCQYNGYILFLSHDVRVIIITIFFYLLVRTCTFILRFNQIMFFTTLIHFIISLHYHSISIKS